MSIRKQTLSAAGVRQALRAHADPERARALARFFKTGPGEYAAGDTFWGIGVPPQRAIARQFAALPLDELLKLLQSPVHEQRLTALLILVRQFERADEHGRQERFRFYVRHLAYVNNWDLVDSSAHKIAGEYLLSRTRGERELLYRLARSKNLWRRRVSIIASAAFINAGDARDTLALAEILLGDEHDLIHKAVGWMLREVGKRIDRKVLLEFLRQHAVAMPRTALRYSIEHLPASERAAWLAMRAERAARPTMPRVRTRGASPRAKLQPEAELSKPLLQKK
ncbi:MAG TPA: DNA alkylation repair protein [Polyangiaceae bacterium]|nr:DNA alkylation repair protein [Polyangiaceae bacterium]